MACCLLVVRCSAKPSLDGRWACAKDEHCGRGWRCANGFCGRGAANGTRCADDADCTSGTCRVAPDLAKYCAPEDAVCSDGVGGGLGAGSFACSGQSRCECVSVDHIEWERCDLSVPDCAVGFCDGSSRECTTRPVRDYSECKAGLGYCLEGTCVNLVEPPELDTIDWCRDGAPPRPGYPPGCGGEVPCNTGDWDFVWPPDTGQTVCSGGGQRAEGCSVAPGTTSCGETPFCGQDAQYGPAVTGPGWDTADRFDESRGGRSNGEQWWRDTLTGLWWAVPDPSRFKEADEESNPCPDGSCAWQRAVDACAAMAKDGIDRHIDRHPEWRLPDRYEVQSLVNYGRPRNACDTPGQPSGSPLCLWSSTSLPADERAWRVECGQGEVDPWEKDNRCYVLCVARMPSGSVSSKLARAPATGGEDAKGEAQKGRAGDSRQAPVPPSQVTVCPDADAGLWGARFWQGSTSEGHRILYDGRTRLWWQRSFVLVLTWPQALRLCEKLDYAGYDDWRLPNVRELSTIIDHTRWSPAQDRDIFASPEHGASSARSFWSSTPSARLPEDAAWYVDFQSGATGVSLQRPERQVDRIAARCVRDDEQSREQKPRPERRRASQR